MARSRLTSALESGVLVLPDGEVHVMRPPEDYDLSALPKPSISHGFKPALDHWQKRGHSIDAPQSPVGTVLVVVPRSKSLARAMILKALDMAPDLIVVDGHKTDGVDSLLKACKPWAAIEGSLAKAHGRLFWFRADARPDWTQTTMQVDGFTTQPGVFSEDKVDRGSAQLAQALPPLKGRVADLGAGWGYLSAAILKHADVTALDMVEAEKLSIECLSQNITDPRATAIWADATTFTGGPYDVVISNPPFHTGRQGTPDLGRAFIATAARILTPRGTVFLVANRHLPYEETLRDRFTQVTEIGGDNGFKLLSATRPKR